MRVPAPLHSLETYLSPPCARASCLPPQLLTYHVVPGVAAMYNFTDAGYRAWGTARLLNFISDGRVTDLVDGMELTTLQGQNVTVRGAARAWERRLV